jgi:TrmH family RNA methyltransferase
VGSDRLLGGRPVITSVQNPRVKAAAKLRDARERRKQQRMIIDGVRELSRAWQAGIELIEVFVCIELCRSDECQRLIADLQRPNAGRVPAETQGRAPAELIEVSWSVFERLTFGARDEGVVGIARMPSTSLDQLQLPANPLVAVLEGIEKPGNVGAVLRSADAAGVSALIVADGGTDLYNPNAIRASLGTIFTMPVCQASSDEALDWLAAHKLAIYAAWVDAQTPYTDADFTRPCAIVLGSEARGLTDKWRQRSPAASERQPKQGVNNEPSIAVIGIPMHGVADSLNVSTAAAVLFFEACRQRMANRS